MEDDAPASATAWRALTRRWPGKSPRDPEGQAHPAAYHMLDVGAVAERLIAGVNLPPPTRDALTVLITLHDLGKISEEFRAMLEGRRAQRRRHWEVSEALMIGELAWLAERLEADQDALRALIAAVSGHHGRPPEQLDDGRLEDIADLAGEDGREDAAAFLALTLETWPDASLRGLSEPEAQRLSWRLAGLTTTADWVGSNEAWFPPTPPTHALPEYLDLARRRAAVAVDAAGLRGAKSLGRPDPLSLPRLRPMQTAAQEIPLREGPMLALIEDETGAGKTEAALLLANRMLAAGKGRGIFFGLPTMATADAMFARLEPYVGRLLDRPSLALAHGRSALSERFRAIVGRDREGEDDASCAPWLADGRRRALLADIGVGTIDQALLGVLPTRFSTLRLWGLANKILIVDEVHEMGDPYMDVQIRALLHAHAAAGGSAILMTATLPLSQRDALIAAFEAGAGRPRPEAGTPDYPALTIAGGGRRSVEPTPSARGPVEVRRLGEVDEAVTLLAQAARDGAACVWVRNAVDDAIDATARLRAIGIEAELLHARFALCDRKRIEAAALARFGRRGEGRAGRVLVATQVVESSLDLCFDVMVSDLAPMASLIQRAGRLWRHMDLRPREARPVAGPALHVLSPDPATAADARWLERVLERGGFVYDLAQQWRTASKLFETGRIDAPHGVRDLIEAVHGDAAEPVPEALAARELEAEGERHARRSLGRGNVIRFEEGYRAGGGASEDAAFPTRLGIEQRTLALARWEEGALVPWAGGEGMEAWMLSEVQASARRLSGLDLPDQAQPEIARLKASWPAWKQAETWICPVAADGEIAPGLQYDPAQGLLMTSP